MKPAAPKKPEDNTLVYFYPALQVPDLVFWLLSFRLSYLFTCPTLNVVEPGGIEPPTSCVQGRRSPS